jgi:Sulfatase
MKVRTILEGCGAGIVFMFPTIWPQLSPVRITLYHSMLPINGVIWAILIDLVMISLLAAFLFAWLETSDPSSQSLLWPFVAGAIAVFLAFSHGMPRKQPGLRSAVIFGVTALAAFALRRYWHHAYQIALRGSRLALLLVGCSMLWIAPELFYLGSRHQRAESRSYVRVAADGPLARLVPQKSSRVVWLLFDELSFDQTFEHRFPGLAMPAFEELERSSLLFEDVNPAGYSTDLVVPSLFLGGHPVTGIRSDLDGNPSLKIVGQSGWHRFDPQATLFADAERAGWTTGVVGWYNPYCRILAGTLDFCYARISNDPDGRTPGTLVLANAIAPIEDKLQLFDNKPNLFAEQHEADLRAIVQQARALIQDEKIRFVFIHLPVPHPPGIYDRKTGQMRASGTYIDNLALADRVLSELMKTLNATASAGKTTVIVCSDHSWRVPMWRPGPGWTREEEAASQGRFDKRPVVMIHFPGQAAELPFPQPFDEIRLHDILQQMLQGKLSSPAGITAWLKTAETPAPMTGAASKRDLAERLVGDTFHEQMTVESLKPD